MVVYPQIDPRPAIDAIPGARSINGFGGVAVPWTLGAMRIAANIGLPAQSPMVRDYDFPIHPGLKPMLHQIQMADFMALHPRCFNLSDMRTGKTLAALWAFEYLRQLGVVEKALVIAKLSTLEGVWQRELYSHFLGRLRGITLHGSRDKRLSALDKRGEIYIVNYDGLTIGSARGSHGLVLGPFGQSIVDREDISCIIIDESATLRNAPTRRWKCVRQIVQPKSHVWQMTGTPAPNAPTDAHAQKKLMFPVEPWPSFRLRTMFRVNQWRWAPKKDAAQEVARFLQPSIRFERAEVMELPPMVYDPPIHIPLTKEQELFIKELKAKLQIQIESGQKITAANEAGIRIKLLQIVCGAIYDEGHLPHPIDATNRLEVLRETIDEAGHKCVVFAPFTSVVELLYRNLNEHKISAEKITGQVGPKDRADTFRRFRDEDSPRILVADPGTVAHGVDLSAANTIIWYGPTDKVEDYTQANQRISGPNQKRGMLIVRLSSTATEREIFRRLDAKETLQGVILDLVREARDHE